MMDTSSVPASANTSIFDQHDHFQPMAGGGSGLHTPHPPTAATRSASPAGISLGDTRSIVMALQSLQEKIRKLETDRNHHQEQCEKARHAHEQYKREVEGQLDRERADHTRREAELRELITRATQERTNLQQTLDESKSDVGRFKGDLEAMFERERQESRDRDARMKEEISQYKSEVDREREVAVALRRDVDHLRTEKESLESTNRRLESTVQDLLAMNASLMEKLGSSGHTRAAARYEDPHAMHEAPSSARRTANNNNANVSVNRSGSAAATGGKRYQSPTQSSMAMRSTPAQKSSPCVSTIRKPSPTRRTPSAHGGAVPQHVAATPRTRTPSTSPPQTDDRMNSALDAVYHELEREMKNLNDQYRELVAQATDANAGMAPEELTGHLNGIIEAMDRKAQQMKLLRTSRLQVEEARGRPPLAKGYEKATRTMALMAEMKSLVGH